MADKTQQLTSQKIYWRKVALDSLWVIVAFLSVYAISSHYNFSDNFYTWARQYEQSVDVDEWLPALLASLVAMLWFAKRRINESRILIKKNHALLQRVLEVQESERKRIARDLHDDLGQYLSAINAQASSLMMDNDCSVSAKLTAERIVSSASHAFHATHHLIRALRPVALDDLGLAAALEHLVDSWRSLSSVSNMNVTSQNPTSYHLNIRGNIDQFNETINIAVFRVVQEALNNVSKHAQATRVFIHIHNQPNCLSIEIKDDGVGFNLSKQSSGYGLQGMAERIDALGGDLTITSQADVNQGNTGTKINVLINTVTLNELEQ